MEMVKLNRLKEVLLERGIKQTWLAEKLCITTVMVNMWCNNKAQPSLTKLSKIAEVLNIDIKDLVESNGILASVPKSATLKSKSK